MQESLSQRDFNRKKYLIEDLFIYLVRQTKAFQTKTNLTLITNLN